MDRLEPSDRGRVRITDRDRELLEFASRHRLVQADHVAVLLGTSATAAATRLRALTRAAYLSSQAPFDRRPRCYSIARRGLQAIESYLPVPRQDLRSHRHDVGVAWLWLAARGGAFGPLKQAVAEREMRSRDAVDAHAARVGGERTEPFAVRPGGVGVAGRERLHYPDLLLVGEGERRVAIELELTAKGRARRERILAGYAADRRIDAVLYLVDRPAVGRAIQASAARLGISDLVQVHGVQWERAPRGNVASRTRVADRQAARAR